MDSIKNLDIFLFEGILENATRHYAPDMHALEVHRGTRLGVSEEQARETGSAQENDNEAFDFEDITYSFDEKLGRMVMNIT